MERVLITGASGFIGSHILREAVSRPDWEIYALTSGRRPVKLPDGVRQVSADLRDAEQCDSLLRELEPDIVLHLAWNLEKRGFLMQDENIQWMEISLRLLRAFNRYGKGRRRFVFSGSSAEYGYGQQICREDGPACPDDLYGVCKKEFADVAEAFGRINGISFADIRFFSIYGAGESHLLHIIPVAIDAMLRGQPFVCKGPNNVWDYVYIDDAAAAAARILGSEVTGRINVGCGPVSMREVTSTIAGLTGAGELLTFENEDAPGKLLIADTTRLREEIGFTPRVGIREGLEKTVAWWRQQMEK